jgi:16S rRNA (cytidine1402-2'-O)-methyltransferase
MNKSYKRQARPAANCESQAQTAALRDNLATESTAKGASQLTGRIPAYLPAYRIDGQRFPAPAPQPGLYIVATPIGNLGDITIRALQILASSSRIACEDTRTTRRLLDRFGIETPMTAYHDHSAPRVRQRLIDRLDAGEAIALVSDAGTPLLSDPGFKLVEEAISAGHAVIPIPGPSSPTAALCAAGLPSDAFFFAGFLPAKTAARKTRLRELSTIPATIIVLESPKRLAASLADMEAVLGGERQAALCREMTKLHETFDRQNLAALAAHYAGKTVKGEIVLVIGPADQTAPALSQQAIDALLAEALGRSSVRDAADRVAADTGLSRRSLYQRALALERKSKP